MTSEQLPLSLKQEIAEMLDELGYGIDTEMIRKIELFFQSHKELWKQDKDEALIEMGKEITKLEKELQSHKAKAFEEAEQKRLLQIKKKNTYIIELKDKINRLENKIFDLLDSGLPYESKVSSEDESKLRKMISEL